MRLLIDTMIFTRAKLNFRWSKGVDEQLHPTKNMNVIIYPYPNPIYIT